MPTRSSRIGAVLYALWGLIHVIGGAMLLQAALQGTETFLRAQGGSSADGLGDLGGTVGSLTIAGNVFAFHAFNLTWLGLLAVFIALRLNWYNSPLGYWLNLAVVGFTDLGLLIFSVRPGVMSLADAWIGPVLFIPAWLLTTIGMRSAATTEPRPSAPLATARL
jgi:hypothetical protein